MNVDEAADHLYGVPLDEFVSARNELAKQVKTDGGADAAKQIKALRKPTVAAWIVNQLVRAERSKVETLIALGDQMRAATAASDGATLRSLTADRKQAVADLVAASTDMAEQAGQRVADDVKGMLNTTLLAAVADPRGGLELLAGRLDKPLEHSGFGPLPTGDPAEVISLAAVRADKESAAKPDRPARKTSKKSAPARAATDDHRDVREELKEAEAELEAAETKVAKLRDVYQSRRDEVEAAQETVDRLEAELATARRQLEKAEVAAERAEDDLDGARHDVEAANRKRRAARLAR